MNTNRLEAFSDGVIAIIITIMVLELKVPHGEKLENLWPLWPVFLSYVLSFVMVGIYWNNHHHMLHAAHHVKGSTLWANLHLLFWLSLTPFTTAWMGENHFAPLPVALYGAVLLMAGMSYYFLARSLLAQEDKNSPLKRALGKDYKTLGSVILYLVGIPMSFIVTWVALLMYVIVAMLWIVPDRRIENHLEE